MAYSQKSNETVLSFFGAIGAEVLGVLVRNPFEIMKQQLQVGNEKTLSGIFGHIYNSYGVRGLYRGFGSLIAREIPFSCIQMPTYEFFKSRFVSQEKKHLSQLEAAFSGFMAGSTAALLTNPIDVIKSNIMTQRQIIYSGFWDCASRLYRDHGIMVFTRGAMYRYIQIGSMSISFFLAYETTMKFFHRH